MQINEYHHLHLNSGELKQKHPEIYQDFFAKNSLVVSCPAILLWSPTYSAGRGGAVLANKLPVRAYVGIRKGNKNQEKQLMFKYFYSFFPENNQFQSVDEVLPYWNSRAGKICNHILQKENFKEPVEISVLCEIPISRGWHTLQVISSALTFAINLWLGRLSPEDIKEFSSIATEKLIESEKFNQALKTAWKVASYAAGVLDDGYAVASTLIDSYYPLIYYHEEDPVCWDKYQDLDFDNPKSYYNLVENINYRLLRMEEIFPIAPYPQWAFNFGIIHIGKECPLVHIYNSQYYRQYQLEEIVKFTTSYFTKTVPDNFKEIPYFLNICKDTDKISGWMSIFKNYRLSSVTLSLEFLKCFYHLAKFGHQVNHLRDFFRLVSLCQNISGFISPPIQFMDQVCAIFNHRGHEINELGVGVKMISQGIQGDILLVTPLSDFDKVFQSVLPDLKKIVKGPICCEYIARCDGLEKEGIKVEQFLGKNLYSSFVSPSTLILKTMDTANKVSSQIITKEELEKSLVEFDIFGNLNEKKIYIKGNVLTSEDVHSTKVTLEILKTFFDRQEKELLSQAFPSSSYAKDRNLMESKIIRPLLAAFKKYTEKNLSLQIRGGLGSKFSIIFKPENLNVGLVSQK